MNEIFNEIFENLFILEMSTNHLGSVERAKYIIDEHAKVIKDFNIKTAIKLQFRDINTFIHPNFKHRMDIQYIKRSTENDMSFEDYAKVVKMIKDAGCIPIATPFDEISVDFCVKMDLPIIKIASADGNDWILLEKIIKTKKPVIISTGGVPLNDIDRIVKEYEDKNIPIAINHCVALYPTPIDKLELNQISFLKNRYPNHVIGLSSHENFYESPDTITISYSKGARMWEKHIDIEDENINAYSSDPMTIRQMYKSLERVKLMCGGTDKDRYYSTPEELKWLHNYARGVYFSKDVNEGDVITRDNIYLAIPRQEGQISCKQVGFNKKNFILMNSGHTFVASCNSKANMPLIMGNNVHLENLEKL